MRTVHCSDHLGGGGVLPRGGVCRGGLSGVCLPGGGVLPGGDVSEQGGACPGQSVCLRGGNEGGRGVSACVTGCVQNDRRKNITLPQLHCRW